MELCRDLVDVCVPIDDYETNKKDNLVEEEQAEGWDKQEK